MNPREPPASVYNKAMSINIPLAHLRSFLAHVNAQRIARLSALIALENAANTLFQANCHLAVYGSLAPGKSNHHVVETLGGKWIRGQVYGRLLHEGWGDELGYPGLLLDEEQDAVTVELLISSVLPEHWERLDEFEGQGYQRSLTTVHCEDGQTRVANIYVLAVDSIEDSNE